MQNWGRELASKEGGRVKGLPVGKNGSIGTFDALHAIVAQVMFVCSVEHSAVNNGQYAQLGWIPNTPGAMFLSPPTDHSPREEENFVYALPGAHAVGQQLTLVHLLSSKTLTPLGMYPPDFFNGVLPARNAVDRFRGSLDDIGREIDQRNKELEVPYVYLQPWNIARSIAI